MAASAEPVSSDANATTDSAKVVFIGSPACLRKPARLGLAPIDNPGRVLARYTFDPSACGTVECAASNVTPPGGLFSLFFRDEVQEGPYLSRHAHRGTYPLRQRHCRRDNSRGVRAAEQRQPNYRVGQRLPISRTISSAQRTASAIAHIVAGTRFPPS